LIYSKKIILVFIISCCCLYLTAQEIASITIKGKTYTITGDNLTIIIGKNPQVNIKKIVPAKIKKNIKNKYQKTISELTQKYKAGLFSLDAYQDSLTLFKNQYKTVQEQAVKLANEFSKVDFSKQSYIYRLAYIIYSEGDISEALEILNNETLENLEIQQARRYLLRAAIYISRNQFDRANTLYHTAISKYPNFETISSYANFLRDRQREKEAIEKYQLGNTFATTPQEKFLINGNLANLYFNLEENDSAVVYCKNALAQIDSLILINPVLKTQVYYVYAKTAKTIDTKVKIFFLRQAIEAYSPNLFEKKHYDYLNLIRIDLGRLLLEKQFYDPAIIEFKEVIRNCDFLHKEEIPFNASIQFSALANLSYCFLEKQQYLKAKVIYEEKLSKEILTTVWKTNSHRIIKIQLHKIFLYAQLNQKKESRVCVRNTKKALKEYKLKKSYRKLVHYKHLLLKSYF